MPFVYTSSNQHTTCFSLLLEHQKTTINHFNKVAVYDTKILSGTSNTRTQNISHNTDTKITFSLCCQLGRPGYADELAATKGAVRAPPIFVSAALVQLALARTTNQAGRFCRGGREGEEGGSSDRTSYTPKRFAEPLDSVIFLSSATVTAGYIGLARERNCGRIADGRRVRPSSESCPSGQLFLCVL